MFWFISETMNNQDLPSDSDESDVDYQPSGKKYFL